MHGAIGLSGVIGLSVFIGPGAAIGLSVFIGMSAAIGTDGAIGPGAAIGLSVGIGTDAAIGTDGAIGPAGAEMHFVGGSFFGNLRSLKSIDHQVGDAVAVHVGEGMQHPARHVARRQHGKVIGIETRIGREGRRYGIEKTPAVLQMRFEAGSVPGHEVDAAVAVVVERVDPAHAPGIVPVSVGAQDRIQAGWRTDDHRIGEGAVFHLDEYVESIDAGHDQVDPAIAVHVPGDVHVRHLTLAGRLETGRDRHESVFRFRIGIPRVQPVRLAGDQPIAIPDACNIDIGHTGPQPRVHL